MALNGGDPDYFLLTGEKNAYINNEINYVSTGAAFLSNVSRTYFFKGSWEEDFMDFPLP